MLPTGRDLDSVPARALWRPVLSSSLVAYQVVPLGAWHATGYGGGARPAVLQTGGSGPISWGATRRESGGAPRKCRTSVRCAFASRLLARKGADWTAADCLRRRRSVAPPVGAGVEREAAGGSTDCLSLLMTPPPHAEPPSRGEEGQYPGTLLLGEAKARQHFPFTYCTLARPCTSLPFSTLHRLPVGAIVSFLPPTACREHACDSRRT